MQRAFRTTLSGNSSPPSAFQVDAPRRIEVPQRGAGPNTWLLPSGSPMPAATWAGKKPRSTMCSDARAAPAVEEDEVAVALQAGDAGARSRAVTTIGGRGTVRSPASDFRRPMVP